MMRLVNIILVGAMIVGMGIVYAIKYDAGRAASNLSRLERSIGQERETIATLNAEWSLLNQPRRLQEFAERYQTYLELDRLSPDQIATIDDIPLRNPATADPGRSIAQIIANTRTGELTGGVPKPAGRAGDKPGDKASDRAKTAAKPIEPRANDPLTRIIPKGDGP
jgi:hypothetical protein